MKRDSSYFRSEILRELKNQKRGPVDTGYGSRVMPVLTRYKGLERFEERKAFQDALEMLLTDEDEEVRRFTVDICLGFFVFRDAV